MCLFCEIAQGKRPAKVVLDWPDVMAFEDIDPKAPVHVLVIPKKHIENVLEAQEEDVELLGRLLLAGKQVARDAGLHPRGCRFVLNSGVEGGQSVWHLHLHVLGGRKMHWPPG